MSPTETLPAPELRWPPSAPSKWERERRAFEQLKPSLLDEHAGKYVAVHNGQVVESGDDQAAVAMRAYSRHGYVPIYVGLVSTSPQPPIRMPTPRVQSARGDE